MVLPPIGITGQNNDRSTGNDQPKLTIPMIDKILIEAIFFTAAEKNISNL